MNIHIRNASDDPIYLQIKDQIKGAIFSGELKAGDKLPSIRFLAKELRISVITTKRAYDELEQDGYIHSVQGKGSFVAQQNEALLQEEHLRKMEEHLKEAIYYGALAQVSKNELKAMIDILEGKDE